MSTERKKRAILPGTYRLSGLGTSTVSACSAKRESVNCMRQNCINKADFLRYAIGRILRQRHASGDGKRDASRREMPIRGVGPAGAVLAGAFYTACITIFVLAYSFIAPAHIGPNKKDRKRGLFRLEMMIIFGAYFLKWMSFMNCSGTKMRAFLSAVQTFTELF